ncbi:MAG: phosphoglucosamine mutase [Rhodospirillaceae bacterium]|jgi:phosphoglucosamine mutase|nr:phosphoglucosamine mutase [Rhodospirillaceae bacterium]MBT5239639.1 phosphoglucosamine mutase [Rhodospirillaceae bacterium]MBT5565547.1 phosphoglucosamine mutase [Rhodospirillaceae bacterium]MBT6089877.1 phosphoglucosamine mutase [Rhodospirillaceae bacterium]MBT6961980.1 phosphoglucosamine mutase [Rhodospirillaceae bacterium]
MTVKKLFGTDGVRGTANQDPMTAEMALKLGMAAGHKFTRGDHRHTVVIGKDTRLSGYMLEPALTAGFIAVGMDVVLVGPIPTPGIAMLTRSLRCDIGVMLSASHNAYEDNGIKLFGPDGFKLSDAIEAEIESLMTTGTEDLRVGSNELGRAQRLDNGTGAVRYIEFVKNTFPRNLRLNGLKVVVDCAHGAAYKVAPSVLWELGADVIPLGVDPNGFNINKDCGSLYPEHMAAKVKDVGADFGMALDGDADRIVVCDELGTIIDGDQILAAIARRWHQSGELSGNGVVSTVMSNLGLERYLESLGLGLERTQVGDRYVSERMEEGGFNLGGEQSGHVILGRHATTGDGLMAGLQLLAALVESDQPASALFRSFEPVPQMLKNVRLDDASTAQKLLDAASVKDAIAAAEARLNSSGRLLIRKSGTEPLIRVMAEGDDADEVQSVVEGVAAVIEAAAA